MVTAQVLSKMMTAWFESAYRAWSSARTTHRRRSQVAVPPAKICPGPSSRGWKTKGIREDRR